MAFPRDRIRILTLEFWWLFYVVFRSKIRFRFWLYRRLRREGEIRPIIERMTTEWSRSVLQQLKCGVEIEGLENLPQQRGFVIMSNHQSKYDIPLLIGYLGRAMGFVTKKELFRVPGLSFWMRQINCMPLNRSNVVQAAQALKELGKNLKTKKSGFIIFPEGTRSRDPDGAIQAFRQGSLRLASDHGLPIVPISIDGTRLLEKGEELIKTRGGGRLVRIKIAPMICPGEMNAPQRKRFMTELRNTIVSNRERIRVTWPAA